MRGSGSSDWPVLQRNKAEAGLRSSETMHRAVLETALDCIVSINENSQIMEFNPAATRTFGYSREEAIGADLAQLLIPPSLREAHYAGLRRYLITGEGPVMNRRIEITGMRSNGQEFPIE